MGNKTHKACRYFDFDGSTLLFKERRCLGLFSVEHRPSERLKLNDDWDNVTCKKCLKHRPNAQIPKVTK